MRGIVNSAAWLEKKKRSKSMRVGRLVEESLIKERCKVWLPPSGEAKLFISSRNFSYLTMGASPQNIKHVRLSALLDSHQAPFNQNMLPILETMDSQEHKKTQNFQGHLKEQHLHSKNNTACYFLLAAVSSSHCQ